MHQECPGNTSDIKLTSLLGKRHFLSCLIFKIVLQSRYVYQYDYAMLQVKKQTQNSKMIYPRFHSRYGVEVKLEPRSV